jgi:hypothetical protein
MESKMTAVEWLLEHDYLIRSTKWPDIVEQALEMEREQHGETWDDALAAFDARGFNRVRAIVDFSDYWANKSKTPPGAHCEEA